LIVAELDELVGENVQLAEVVADLPSVFTDPQHPFIERVLAVLRSKDSIARFELKTMPYFTDGSVLQPHYGNCPTIILGPGEASQAHQTDEFCLVKNIYHATDIYLSLCRSW
jgi:succinyl-diaminopimelate desuccinylase